MNYYCNFCNILGTSSTKNEKTRDSTQILTNLHLHRRLCQLDNLKERPQVVNKPELFPAVNPSNLLPTFSFLQLIYSSHIGFGTGRRTGFAVLHTVFILISGGAGAAQECSTQEKKSRGRRIPNTPAMMATMVSALAACRSLGKARKES